MKLAEVGVIVALAAVTGVVTWIKDQQYQKRRRENYGNREHHQHMPVSKLRGGPVRIRQGGLYQEDRDW